MKPVFWKTAALTLPSALSLAPAGAQNVASGRTTRPTAPERAAVPPATDASAAPHWQYQYGYDRRAAWRGHWILVR
jgi:hypothetical protein